MSVDEQQVNDALRALDEDHRLQRIRRDEYRQRRRALLESLARDTAGADDTVRRTVPRGIAFQRDASPDGRDARSSESAEDAGRAITRPLATCAVLGMVAVSVLLVCWFAFA
jgi:hypothetical protein